MYKALYEHVRGLLRCIRVVYTCVIVLRSCVFFVCVCGVCVEESERRREEEMIKLFSVKEKQRAAAADGQDAGADRQSNAGKLTAGELRIQKVCNAHESGRNGMENDDDVCMEESQSLWDFSDSMIRLEVFWNEQERMVIDIRLSEFSHLTCGCWHTYVIARYPSLRVCRLDCSFTGHLRAESREDDEHAVRDARDRSIYITHLQDDVRAYMCFGACRSHVLILRIRHTMPSARDDTIQNARARVCVSIDPLSPPYRFPEGKDKLLNFEVILKPDEGYYKGTVAFSVLQSSSLLHHAMQCSHKTRRRTHVCTCVWHALCVVQ